MDDRQLVRQDWLRPDGVRESWISHYYDTGTCSGVCGGWHIRYHYGFWRSLRKNWGYWLIAAVVLAFFIALIVWSAPIPEDWADQMYRP